MDHSGCLPEAIEALDPEAVYASTKGVEALEAHFGLGDRLTAVATGESVDLGSDEVTFVETPMLHWPDSMVSYLAGEKVLFAQDAFGQHLASAHMWADDIPADVLEYEAAKYYANIVLPFSPMVAKTVAKLREMDLPLAVIAPDHGPLYRKDLDWIVGRYAEWAEQKPTRKAVVVFDTMWQSDTLMAKAVAEGLAEGGAAPVKVMPMGSAHRSDVATEILDAGVLVAGSPTINQQMFPTMADVLCYLAGLKRKHLVGAVFGSYGWSSGATRKLQDQLSGMGVELVADPLTCQYVPTESDLAACREFGRKVAEANAARL
jgi:flavorubredoxin